MGHFRCKCPINFSLSRHSDKLKLIGHQTDPLPQEENALTPWIAVVQSSHRSTVREVAWGQTTIKLGSGGSIGIPTEPLDYLPPVDERTQWILLMIV